MDKQNGTLFSESLVENLVNGFLFSCGIALLVAFVNIPFVNAIDWLATLIDWKALQFVSDKYEPFRVSLEAGFLGSLLTFLILVLISKRAKKT